MCVECSIFKGTEPSPLQESFSDSATVRQKGGPAYRDPPPPPVVPLPESIAAQVAYAEALLPGSDPARNVSIGPPRTCYRVPFDHVVNRGTPVAFLDSRSRMSRRGRATRVGSPCSPDFPNIMSCLRSPVAAGPRMTH